MSIKEILDRYNRGLPIDGHKVPVYDDSEIPTPDFKHMDLADLEEWQDRAMEEIGRIRSQHRDQQDALRSKQYALLLEQAKKDLQQAPPSQYPRINPGSGAAPQGYPNQDSSTNTP